VQPAGALRRSVLRLVEAVSRLLADLQRAWERPRLPVIALPVGAAMRVTIGRGPDCDCVVSEPTVSRRHAELCRDGDRWLLRDLGSRNGTRVNGMRVLEPTEVYPGDRVARGDARYRLASPPRGSGRRIT
jgi:FHA domain